MKRLIFAATAALLISTPAAAQGLLVENANGPKPLTLQGPTIDPAAPDARYLLTYDAAGTPVWVKSSSLISDPTDGSYDFTVTDNADGSQTLTAPGGAEWTHTPSDPHPTFAGDLVFDAETNTVSYTDIDPVFSTREIDDGCKTETLIDDEIVHTALNRDERQSYRQLTNLGAITITEAQLSQFPVGERVELDSDTITWTNPSPCRAAFVQVRVRQGNVGFGNLEAGNHISTFFTVAGGGTPGPVLDTRGNTQVIDFRTGDEWQFADFSVNPGASLTFDVVHAIELNEEFVEYAPGPSNYTTGARGVTLMAWIR